MNVVIGTYNHTLIGLNFTMKGEEKEQWIFSPIFTDQGHDGCIKTVAICGKYLASGSSDEVIRLFDLKKNVDLGSLIQQNGSITNLEFCGKSYLLSSSDDGTICIWKCKTWECIKSLTGHRNAVNSISIHPSGRLLLSVSKDRTIRTWNLLTGRSAYTTKLPSVGDLVAWSPNGGTYAVASGVKVASYSISESKESTTFSCSKAILSINFVTAKRHPFAKDSFCYKHIDHEEDIILLSGELDEIIMYDLRRNTSIQSFKAHSNRVKSLKSLQHPVDERYLLIFSLSSDGTLKAWMLNKEEIERPPIMLTEFHIPGRPTCMAVGTIPPK